MRGGRRIKGGVRLGMMDGVVGLKRVGGTAASAMYID